jgi:predicted ATPase/class 3 adenylate cyclase
MTTTQGDLPTGTLTLLFTDIEGSTRLARHLGRTFRSQLAEHHRILSEAISAHQGTVSSVTGDSFFAVFTNARSAAAAAVAIQQGLDAHPWAAEQIRARVGLHTADIAAGDGYPEIARAARIMASGHGGQIVLSDTTRALIEDDLPDGTRVKTLGAYRLKDVLRPERLHQLEVSGLPSAFPPLRALDVRGGHLPPEATTFIGRAAELSAIADLLLDRRLVTLTGPGGTGKTRLAIRCAAHVAERFADGAFFVALATTTDVTSVAAMVASAIGLPDDRERSIVEVLRDWLHEREVLVVLDNLEQIEGVASAVDGLLAQAPRLRVLATSRGPLRVAGEQEFSVPPLSVPAAGSDAVTLEASDAVRLFIDRARLVRSGFSPSAGELDVVADIARRLDGLPLAIELAAARVRLFPIGAIRDRLAHRLDSLGPGPASVPLRQQSLRQTIGWSHDLLEEPERVMFRRLAAFVGGWTSDAAEAVAGGTPARDVEAALEHLVDQSLIQPVQLGDAPRFAMLATIGEFASEVLEASDEAAAVMGRHATFFRVFAQRAREESEGPAAAAWFERIEADLDNFRAAIGRAAADGGIETALAIAAALGPFWLRRNHSAEGQRILIGLIDRAPQAEGPELAAAAAEAAGNATWLGDYATGRRMGELAVAAYRRLEDRRGLAFALPSLGFSTIELDPVAALRLVEEGLEISRELGDLRREGQTYLARATAQFALGRLPDVRTSLERSIDLARQADDWYFELFARFFLGRIKLLMGQIAEGIADSRSVLETSRARDLGIGVAISLEYFGEVAIWAGDLPRAVRLGAAAARIKEELGGGIPPRIGGGLEPLVVGRERLPADEFDREVAAGRVMDSDTAIEEALAAPLPSDVPIRAASSRSQLPEKIRSSSKGGVTSSWS